MKCNIALPAAWFLLPLDSPVVSDPDLHDDPPRYKRPPKGGWKPVGDAVVQIYAELQNDLRDPLSAEVVLKYEQDGRLSREQKQIVQTWFMSEAPTLGPGDTSWINGRHRSWGLKSAGLPFAPVLLIPFCDAITLWHPDLDNGGGPSMVRTSYPSDNR